MVLGLHYGCEHITIEEEDALGMQFAKGKTELETKRRRWNLGFRILAKHRVTETQYLEDVLPLENCRRRKKHNREDGGAAQQQTL